jgi:hypothetical protein
VLLDAGRREEPDHAQILGTGVVEVVRGPLGEDDDVAASKRSRPVVQQEISRAREDELGFLAGVGMTSQPLPGRTAK